MVKKKKYPQWIFFFLILLFYAGVLSYIIYRNDFYQWDFKTYYYAGKAHALGLNPYGIANLSKLAKKQIRFYFRYPPYTLWFFRLFSLFNYKTAYYLYLLAKLILLAAIYYIWVRILLKSNVNLWFYPFSLLAFNSCIFVDLMSGNIAIFEYFFLGLSFIFFLNRRPFWFCLLVIVASSFKFTPIFFLLLLLFDDKPRKYIYLASSFFVFATGQLIYYFTDPLYEDFLLRNRHSESGWANPSLLSMTKSFIEGLFSLFKHQPPLFVSISIFALIIAAILYLSWKACAVLKATGTIADEDKRRWLIMNFCLIYALLVPRFVAYSHIILIVPAYFAMQHILSKSEAFWLMLVLISLQTPEHAGPPGLEIAYGFIWTYHSILIAVVLWALYQYKILKCDITI